MGFCLLNSIMDCYNQTRNHPFPCRMAALLVLGKACFLLFLLLTHLVLFGVPALQRFLEAGVTVEESVEQAASLPAPAVTICPSERNFSAWKNTTRSRIYNTYHTMCGGAASAQDVKDCVEEKTFNFTETFPFRSQQGMGLLPRVLPRVLVEDLSSPEILVSETMVAVAGKKLEKEIQAKSIAARQGWRIPMELWQGLFSKFALRFALGLSLNPKKSCLCYLVFLQIYRARMLTISSLAPPPLIPASYFL